VTRELASSKSKFGNATQGEHAGGLSLVSIRATSAKLLKGCHRVIKRERLGQVKEQSHIKNAECKK
jgi:hypothetical protein